MRIGRISFLDLEGGGEEGISGCGGGTVLGVTTSAVIRAAYSEELPELQKYL
jgi:hypothetical protein